MTLYGERYGVVQPVLQIAIPVPHACMRPAGRCTLWLAATIVSSTSLHRRILKFCWNIWGK